VIVCFTFNLNCEERPRSFNVQSAYTTEEQLTRNTEKKERAMNANEKKVHLFNYDRTILQYRLRIHLSKSQLFIVKEENFVFNDIRKGIC